MRPIVMLAAVLISTLATADELPAQSTPVATPAATTVLKPKPLATQLQRQLKPADAATIAARNNAASAGDNRSDCDRLKDGAVMWSSDGKPEPHTASTPSPNADAQSIEQRQREAERLRLGCH